MREISRRAIVKVGGNNSSWRGRLTEATSRAGGEPRHLLNSHTSRGCPLTIRPALFEIFGIELPGGHQ